MTLEHLRTMDEEDFERFLLDAIQYYATKGQPYPHRLRTFEQARFPTLRRGLVVAAGDREFRITIERSR